MKVTISLEVNSSVVDSLVAVAVFLNSDEADMEVHAKDMSEAMHFLSEQMQRIDSVDYSQLAISSAINNLTKILSSSTSLQ